MERLPDKMQRAEPAPTDSQGAVLTGRQAIVPNGIFVRAAEAEQMPQMNVWHYAIGHGWPGLIQFLIAPKSAAHGRAVANCDNP